MAAHMLRVQDDRRGGVSCEWEELDSSTWLAPPWPPAGRGANRRQNGTEDESGKTKCSLVQGWEYYARGATLDLMSASLLSKNNGPKK